MSDRNYEILFAYLQNILQDPQIQFPEHLQLDEPYQKFGERLKQLHSDLKRLTCQAEQVASGDLSQHTSFFGNFSDAFNTMVDQLREREELLKKEATHKQDQEAVTAAYNHLLTELTRKRSEWILVVDVEKKDILFCNKKELEEVEKFVEGDICDICRHKLSFKQNILNWSSEDPYSIWEAEDKNGYFYQITSFLTEWQGRKAYAHVIMDVTKETREARQLASKAYHDPGTGIENRRYFEEYMAEIMEEKREVTLCYMDLDGLKYVNDRFGHLEGDEYIRSYVAAIKPKIRTTDVFARIGGDEFCLVFPGCHKEVVTEKIQEALQQMVDGNQKPYPASFSFGIIELHKEDGNMALEEVLEKADTEMYICKRQNKKKFHSNREVR